VIYCCLYLRSPLITITPPSFWCGPIVYIHPHGPLGKSNDLLKSRIPQVSRRRFGVLLHNQGTTLYPIVRSSKGMLYYVYTLYSCSFSYLHQVSQIKTVMPIV
jgi:hypothetical protein